MATTIRAYLLGVFIGIVVSIGAYSLGTLIGIVVS